MNKIGEIEWQRIYLIERLPEPLTPASMHLQVFDNYVNETPIRLRQIRDPYSKSWSRAIQKRTRVIEDGLPIVKTWEVPLNDAEYAAFTHLECREILKNRYFHEFGSAHFTFDVYLGALWGLNMAYADFRSAAEMTAFEPPNFAAFDVTGEEFFYGENLVGKEFVEIQAAVAQIGGMTASGDGADAANRLKAAQ